MAQVVEVRKREHESPDSLIRRFQRRVAASRILLTAKRGRFYDPPKSKGRRRVEALRRSALKKERELLRKLGKLEERSWGE